MIVSFSGIDGSGKTSMSKRLAKYFNEIGIKSRYMRPNYDNNEIIKKYCFNKYNDEHAYYPNLNSDLYLSSLTMDWLNWWYNSTIEENTLYFCDRYIIDVYTQSLQYNANPEVVSPLFEALPKPLISFYLDIKPENAENRIKKRSYPEQHKLESLNELKRLQKNYKIAEKNSKWSYHYLNAEGKFEQNVQHAFKIIRSYLSLGEKI
ncbi:deoxynucleoside kinase [Virgibacillus sp. Bac330]|uniref:deoxynucleoside kinase n=1 Tax=Virgibacillus sp. Bac330 TaxID=2419841 RepID=UPI000EF4FF05|nr:deoxynucleoside kinase [Virgibacillus sp. Bac330]